MPVKLTYPGVSFEEIPSGVRTITGVATSITAFIGRALRGPVNEPLRIHCFADFERKFGGLWIQSTLSYAVQHYFLNGGTDAIIVRVHKNASAATLRLPTSSDPDLLILEATSPGAWGNKLRARVDHDTNEDPEHKLFNLTVEDVVKPATDDEVVLAAETFRNISIDPDDARFVTKVLEQQSGLVRVQGAVPVDRPAIPDGPIDAGDDGTDGDPITDEQLVGSVATKNGIGALEKTDLFNLMCIPPLTREKDVDKSTWDTARAYCKKRRAMLIVDAPSRWKDTENAIKGVDDLMTKDENAAVYFPRIKMGDPLKEHRLEEFAPCGAVAGIYARTDTQRGIWKAPAGLDATLTGVRGLSYKLTDGENGRLNSIGVNCLRTFPVIGTVICGARTLEGADNLAAEWKYIPVRRLALFIGESLYRGTQWVVFELNDEPLWAQIRLSVGAFMHSLFLLGAFQGQSAQESYFVKCDKETTTQNDINLGVVNIHVGFAPFKPAEFVIIKFQQIASQTTT